MQNLKCRLKQEQQVHHYFKILCPQQTLFLPLAWIQHQNPSQHKSLGSTHQTVDSGISVETYRSFLGQRVVQWIKRIKEAEISNCFYFNTAFFKVQSSFILFPFLVKEKCSLTKNSVEQQCHPMAGQVSFAFSCYHFNRETVFHRKKWELELAISCFSFYSPFF